MSTHKNNAMALGLEQGVMALLGSKSSDSLQRLLRPSELVLACCALVAVLRGVPEATPVLGRVSRLMVQALSTIGLNSLLFAISDGLDPPLACLNLLAIFLLGQALDPNGSSTLTAQFLLVSNLSRSLQESARGEVLCIVWTLAFVPSGAVPADIAELAQLVTVDSLSAWLRAWLPHSLLLASTVVLLYLFAPFIDEFPALGRLYRFAVFALSNDAALAATPLWLLAAGLWALWQIEPDPISKRLAAVAGCNVAVLAVLDIMRFAMDNDPAPTLIALLVAIRILEAAAPVRVHAH